MKKKTKEKIIYKEDDGRTIYSMEQLTGNKPKSKNENQIELTKQEKKALKRAATISLLPMLICILVGFGIVYFLLQWWLKGGK